MPDPEGARVEVQPHEDNTGAACREVGPSTLVRHLLRHDCCSVCNELGRAVTREGATSPRTSTTHTAPARRRADSVARRTVIGTLREWWRRVTRRTACRRCHWYGADECDDRLECERRRRRNAEVDVMQDDEVW